MFPGGLANFFGFPEGSFACVVVVAVIVFLATSTRRTSRRCPRCREINRPYAIFCAQCGERLPGR